MLQALTISLVLSMAPAAPAGKIVKDTFGSGGGTRAYYLFVPERRKPEEPAPLIVLLHGSGRAGRSLIEPWAPLAKQHGIPIAIWVGTNDHFFPLTAVRATRDALKSHGFAAELTEIGGHTHAYYDRALEINKRVWEFFQKHRLDGDPTFQRYETR